jgi:hypothetical protein
LARSSSGRRWDDNDAFNTYRLAGGKMMARRRWGRGDEQAIVGVVLVILGIWFLAGLPGSAEIGGPIGRFLAAYWPILLVIAGLALLVRTYSVLRR